MEKYLILGEVYENKKVYAIFYTGEYFICDLSKIKAIQKPTTTDLKMTQISKRKYLHTTITTGFQQQ